MKQSTTNNEVVKKVKVTLECGRPIITSSHSGDGCGNCETNTNSEC